MKQSTVLVVADQGSFAQSLMSRWHSERTVPAFTVMNSEVFHADAGRTCDLLIVGPIARQRFSALLTTVATLSQPVILVAGDNIDALSANNKNARIMVLRQHEGWVDLLILLGSECLRRLDATERAEKAERSAADLAGQAMLGRYMLDMRHSLNNALTSVLGNAELLLLEPGNFSEEVRDQLATIRGMSLRINEILARFSSLEAELAFAKRESRGESHPYVRATAVGWSTF